MTRIWVFGLLTLFFLKPLQAQDDDDHHHDHHHSLYELGLSLGYGTIMPEEEHTGAVHVHLSRLLGEHGLASRFGVGVGVETLLTEHAHYAFMASFILRPFGRFKIDLSPGLLLAEHEDEMHREFILHGEIAWEFHFHGFDLGPVLGAAFAGEDEHYIAGLHLGIGL